MSIKSFQSDGFAAAGLKRYVSNIEDMDIPGFKLHPLKGDRKGLWSISVSGHWRITFDFKDGNAYVVNYEDYH